MDAFEQSYYEHRQFSNSPIRQAEYESDLTIRREEKAAQTQGGPEQEGMLGRVLGLPGEAGKGVVEGIHQMGQDILDLTQFLGSFSPGQNPYAGTPLEAGYMETLYKLPKPGFQAPQGVPESLVRGLGQFLPFFVPAGRATGLAGASTRLGRVGRGAAAGAMADFAGDPDQGNLFELLRDVLPPGAHREVMDILSTSPDEGQLKRRLKNALAGTFTGVALDTATNAIGYAWKRGQTRAFKGQIEQAFKSAEGRLGKAQSPEEMVKAAGGVFRAADASGVWFDDPVTRSTLLLTEKPTPQAIAKKIRASRKEFAKSFGEQAHTALKGGGFTIHPTEGPLSPTRGYAVSVHPERSTPISGREASPEDLAQFYLRNVDRLSEDPKLALGGWVDTATGTTHLDLSRITDDLQEAMKLAVEHKQKGIYDFEKGDTLRLLEHYSNVPGLTEIDPSKFGTGQAGREAARAGQPGFIPRSYHYEAGAEPEARFRGAPFRYHTLAAESMLYDVGKDPLGLRKQAGGDATKLEGLVKEAGFTGYMNTSAEAAPKGAVASFEKLPVMHVTEREVGSLWSPLVKAGDAARQRLEKRMGLVRGLFTDETGALGKSNIEVQKGTPFDLPEGEVSPQGTYERNVWEVWKDGELFEQFKSKAKAEKAARDLRARQRQGGYLDPNAQISADLIRDLGVYGASLIARGIQGTQAWTRQMVGEFGEAVRPHLDKLRREAENQYRRYLRSGFNKMQATQNLIDYLKVGKASGFGWYDKVLPELTKLYGERDAQMLIGFLAATSPNTTVKANVTLAMKAFEQWRLTGGIDPDAMANELTKHASEGLSAEAFRGFMGTVIGNLNRAVKGETLSGPKVQNFHKALLGDKDAVVIDRWMIRALFPEKAAKMEAFGSNLTDNQYAFLANFVRQEARKRNISPVDLQAAIWVGIKKLKGTREDFAGTFDTLIKEHEAKRAAAREAKPAEGFDMLSEAIDELSEVQ